MGEEKIFCEEQNNVKEDSIIKKENAVGNQNDA
jgi:hypothetical protein